MFAWRMARPVNPFCPFAGLPLVGLGSFAVQTSKGRRKKGKGEKGKSKEERGEG
jgi:hypothetical protein